MSTVVRRLLVALTTVILLTPDGAAHAQPCWSPPVDALVVDPFREPECRWCPGNRGLEYGNQVGAAVTAVATGRVSFAGTIAGVVYVVVRHGDGVRATYSNLRSETYDVGDLVVRGSTIGRAAGRVHFGLRAGEQYLDPAPYLGRLVHRPRLIPVDGTRPNDAPPPRLRCATGRQS